MAKAKIGASCNQSPAVGEIAGAHLTEAAGKGVKCDTNGNMVLTEAATEPFYGVLSMETPDSVAAEDTVTVFTQNAKVLAEAGEALAKGDLVAAGADGQFKKAATGDYLAGQAVSAASGKGSLFWLELAKGGKC